MPGCSGHVEELGFRRGPGSEKQGAKLIFAEDALQFPEGEERDERAEDDQSAREQIIDADLVQGTCYRFTMNQQSDAFFDQMKDQHQQTK